MRAGILLLLPVALAGFGCRATSSLTGEFGASSGSGSGGHEGGGGDADNGGFNPSSSGAGGAGSSGAEEFTCPEGAIVCEGDVARVCDGKGGYASDTSCAPKKCAPNIGCAECTPGTATCSGNKSIVCLDDGSGTVEHDCDPIQGMTCNPETGRCEGACSPESLGQSYFGCDYFPTVTNNMLVPKSADFAVAVSNTTTSSVNVTVTRGQSTVATDVIGPSSVKIIVLPWISQLDQQVTQRVVDGAYRLRANRPVTVYQYNPLQYIKNGVYTYTNDASLLLPVNAWSGNYRVVSRNHWVYASSTHYGGLYAVTAAHDGTVVTVTPSPTGNKVLAGAGIAANGSGTVQLDAGDVLQVFTAYGGGLPDVSDVTGTLISADKPVQVIGGHLCTNIPHNISACDHLEESMPPLETLATEYIVTAPLINNTTVKQRMVRIVATADGTTLSYDPPQGGAPASVAQAGGYVEIGLNQADFAIMASKPVLVAEYFTGQSLGGGAGDPAMAVAVATAQYRTKYLFHAPTNYSSNYVNIVAPEKAVVTLDGQAVSSFAPIGSSGYRVARVPLSNSGDGNHVVESTLPCGITVYGYGQYTSYWYPGGLDLTPLGL